MCLRARHTVCACPRSGTSLVCRVQTGPGASRTSLAEEFHGFRPKSPIRTRTIRPRELSRNHSWIWRPRRDWLHMIAISTTSGNPGRHSSCSLGAALSSAANTSNKISLNWGVADRRIGSRLIRCMSNFGDHLATPTYLPGPGWESRLHECVRLVKRRRGAQGCADLIHLPERGIDGNSHVVVQDRNNQQIADIVIDWFSDIRQYNASFSQFP
ncbi:hypothetical protein BLA14095_00598 [Burkholderia lata]|nr:hypothetical protein BLA14095_00598 [Burkholderia lata]